MGAEELKKRMQAFGIDVIRLVETFPYSGPGKIIGSQLVRCGTSIGANFRAACRARSRPDFIAKLKIAEEECDEAVYWLEILLNLGMDPQTIPPILEEANQILAILVSSIKSTRSRT